MERPQLSFDQLPNLVFELSQKLDDLTNLINERVEAPSSDRWMNIKEFAEYHPAKPAITTVYTWAQAGAIPFVRQGKQLLFRKSEIDRWLTSKTSTTATQVAQLADARLSSVRPSRRKGVRRA